MGGIHGIGGLPEPINLNSASGRTRRSEDRPAAAASSDTVHVSAAGASLSRLTGLSDEVRAERIAQARENLEKGTHQILEVVEVVASRISKYIDAE